MQRQINGEGQSFQQMVLENWTSTGKNINNGEPHPHITLVFRNKGTTSEGLHVLNQGPEIKRPEQASNSGHQYFSEEMGRGEPGARSVYLMWGRQRSRRHRSLWAERQHSNNRVGLGTVILGLRRRLQPCAVRAKRPATP